jgi:hypothetical protein
MNVGVASVDHITRSRRLVALASSEQTARPLPDNKDILGPIGIPAYRLPLWHLSWSCDLRRRPDSDPRGAAAVVWARRHGWSLPALPARCLA